MAARSQADALAGIAQQDCCTANDQPEQRAACRGAHAALSADARSLLLQMLRTDPSARISMAEVCTHPWFTRDLPPAALRMNDDCLRLSGADTGDLGGAAALLVSQAHAILLLLRSC